MADMTEMDVGHRKQKKGPPQMSSKGRAGNPIFGRNNTQSGKPEMSSTESSRRMAHTVKFGKQGVSLTEYQRVETPNTMNV
jgi:hypothetical protein